MAVAMSKTTAPTTGKRAQMLIDGSWVDSTSGNKISVESPGNRQIIASIPRGGAPRRCCCAAGAARRVAVGFKQIPRGARFGRLTRQSSRAVASAVWTTLEWPSAI